MENRIAFIENNRVVNIAEGSDEWANSQEQETVNITNVLISGSEIGIGYGYINNEFIFPTDLLTPEEKLNLKIENEKIWRDNRLKSSDWIVPLTDHPQHSAYMTYRQELRDYPSQPDFPNGIRPTKP